MSRIWKILDRAWTFFIAGYTALSIGLGVFMIIAGQSTSARWQGLLLLSGGMMIIGIFVVGNTARRYFELMKNSANSLLETELKISFVREWLTDHRLRIMRNEPDLLNKWVNECSISDLHAAIEECAQADDHDLLRIIRERMEFKNVLDAR